MRALVEYFLHRSIFVNLLTIIVIGLGGYIAATMNREVFPNIDFEVVIITTVYPGASPPEVEKLVTIPIEKSLQEVDGLKEYRSSSIEGRSTITVRVDPDVVDDQKVVDDIRGAVDRAEDLPAEIEKPVLSQINTARYPVIQWSLSASDSGGGADYATLRAHAARLEREFLALDSVARVDRRGWLDREIFVEANPALLERNYLDTSAINRALAARNIDLPGGSINVGKREVIIRTVGEFQTLDEISRLYVRSNDAGESLQLRDLARISEGFEEPEYLESTRNRRSIGLTVIQRESADILSTVRDTRRIVLDFAPRALLVRAPCAGCSQKDLVEKIEKPLRDWLGSRYASGPTGSLWWKRARRASGIVALPVLDDPAAGIRTAGFKITLNPDYLYDSELKRPGIVFDSIANEMRGELSAAIAPNGGLALPAGARPFEFETVGGAQGVQITDFNDISYIVKARLGVLVNNGLSGLVLVLLSLFVFMGWRTAVMVAVGVPISFGIAFMVMSVLGVTMNMISMLSLVIVVGIVVDDAIIVSENIYRYIEEGLDYYQAAAQGAAEVFAPVMATVTTTIAAFAPMLFVSGIFGKFVYTIPVVIILVLIASALECFLILPSHVYDMNRAFPGRGSKEQGGSWFLFVRERIYRPGLRRVLNHRWAFLLALFFMLAAAGFIQKNFGKFKLFPTSVDAIYIKASLPSEATKEETERFLFAIGREVERLPDSELDTYVARSGIQKSKGTIRTRSGAAISVWFSSIYIRIRNGAGAPSR
jgi:multidrug efflux pump subunit AcrB